MQSKFSQLTEAETERLAMLAEECAEVIQIVGKILRHGYNSWHPDNPAHNNRWLLRKEIVDVIAVLSAMDNSEDINLPAKVESEQAWNRKLRYCHYQGDEDA